MIQEGYGHAVLASRLKLRATSLAVTVLVLLPPLVPPARLAVAAAAAAAAVAAAVTAAAGAAFTAAAICRPCRRSDAPCWARAAANAGSDPAQPDHLHHAFNPNPPLCFRFLCFLCFLCRFFSFSLRFLHAW